MPTSSKERPLLIITLDGCAPSYVENSGLSNLRAFEESGYYKRVVGMMPSVTNVNNASIVTGLFPIDHGVASNYWYDRETDSGGWIEAASFLRTPTYMELVGQHQGHSAFISAKGKLQSLLGTSADISLSSEQIPEALAGRFAEPPPLRSLENSAWVLDAARMVIAHERPDFVYVTTTDYLMHHHAPEEQPSRDHMERIDRAIGDIAETASEYEIYVTADHGMNRKARLINLQAYLDRAEFRTRVILPIEDRYTENHPNEESGSAYVYVPKGQPLEPIEEHLRSLNGVERVLTQEDAAREFSLPPESIGELLVLADESTAFGASGKMSALEMESPVRSHGSMHEREVPLFALNPTVRSSEMHYTLDIVRSRIT